MWICLQNVLSQPPEEYFFLLGKKLGGIHDIAGQYGGNSGFGNIHSVPRSVFLPNFPKFRQFYRTNQNFGNSTELTKNSAILPNFPKFRQFYRTNTHSHPAPSPSFSRPFFRIPALLWVWKPSSEVPRQSRKDCCPPPVYPAYKTRSGLPSRSWDHRISRF